MFRNFFNTFANCFKIPELKSRILFTLGVAGGGSGAGVSSGFPALMAMFWRRILQNRKARAACSACITRFAGGASDSCAIGALGIMPYISATIIIQLLTAVCPRLSKLAREEGGRTKIIQYGRYLTVLLVHWPGMLISPMAGCIRQSFRVSGQLVSD